MPGTKNATYDFPAPGRILRGADDRAAYRFAEGVGNVVRATTDPGDVFGTPLGDILAGGTPFPN